MFLVLPYTKPAALPGTTGFHGNHLVSWAISELLPWQRVVLWVMGCITSRDTVGFQLMSRAHPLLEAVSELLTAVSPGLVSGALQRGGKML